LTVASALHSKNLAACLVLLLLLVVGMMAEQLASTRGGGCLRAAVSDRKLPGAPCWQLPFPSLQVPSSCFALLLPPLTSLTSLPSPTSHYSALLRAFVHSKRECQLSDFSVFVSSPKAVSKLKVLNFTLYLINRPSIRFLSPSNRCLSVDSWL